MNNKDLLKKAMRLLIAKKKFVSLVHIETKRQEIEDLIIKYDYKFCISSNLRSFNISLLVPIYQPTNFSATFVQISVIDYQLVDKKKDHLIKMIQLLALVVCTQQNNTNPSTTQNISPRFFPIPLVNHSQTSNSPPTLHSNYSERVTKYL